MNYINTLLQSDLPLISALLLGLLTAINPCQLAICVSALTYIQKRDLGKKNAWVNSMLFVLGRTLTYILLAWLLICLIGGGQNVEAMQTVLSHGETILPYALFLMGLFLLYRGWHQHKHPHGEDCHHAGLIIRRQGPLGALILGMILAFAFCPESAVFYFGAMLPISTSSHLGAIIPVVYAIASALPILGIAWLLQRASISLAKLSMAFEHAQRIINVSIGVLFILIAAFFWFGE